MSKFENSKLVISLLALLFLTLSSCMPPSKTPKRRDPSSGPDKSSEQSQTAGQRSGKSVLSEDNDDLTEITSDQSSLQEAGTQVASGELDENDQEEEKNKEEIVKDEDFKNNENIFKMTSHSASSIDENISNEMTALEATSPQNLNVQASTSGLTQKCQGNHVLENGICYSPCDEGDKGIAFLCYKPCPTGHIDDGLLCRLKGSIVTKKSYGRGAGKVPGCSSSQEKNAGLCYNKCKSGYKGVGPVCWQYCPSGYKNHPASCYKNLFKWFFKKSYGRGVGKIGTSCAAGYEKKSGLCYKNCSAGYKGIGPVCWGSCPAGHSDDGALCRKNVKVVAKKSYKRDSSLPIIEENAPPENVEAINFGDNCVRAFKDSNYRGQMWKFCSMDEAATQGKSWNNKVSSINIPTGFKVKVCDGSDGKTPCRSYYKSVPSMGSWFNDKTSSIKFSKFATEEFYMIFASDSQLYWACSTRECKEIICKDNPDKCEDEKGMGILTNDWHVKSIQELGDELGFNKVAGVIVNGDLTAFGHKNEYDAYVNYYEKRLNLNLFPGLGNHDNGKNNVDDCAFNNCAIRMSNYIIDRARSLNPESIDVAERKYYKFPTLKRDVTGSLSYSFDIGDIHFVQFNNYPTYETTYKGWDFAKAREDNFKITTANKWLRKDLEKAKSRNMKIVLNMHDSWPRGPGKAEYLDIIRDHNIIAVFAGHIHQHAQRVSDLVAYSKRIPVFRSGSAQTSRYLVVKFTAKGYEVQAISSIYGKHEKVGRLYQMNY